MLNAIILAAGKSTRFMSTKSKVLHDLIDKPIINYSISAIKSLNADNIVLVVPDDHSDIKAVVGDNVHYAVQKEQLGTGHAVYSATSYLKDFDGETIIIMGDTPLIKAETLKNMITKNKDHDLTFATIILSEPNHYGRVVKNKYGAVEKIVEYKHATPVQQLIKEVNTGVYCIKNKVLFKYLPDIINSATSGEYKFTDIVELLVKTNHKVQGIKFEDQDQFLGINTKEDYNKVLTILALNNCKKHLQNGVNIINTSNTYIGSNVVIEPDVTIYPNTFLLNNSYIKTGTTIFANSYIDNANIAGNVTIDNAKIVDSSIGQNCTIGPFSHIRKNSVIGKSVRVGNYVEIKNSKVGDGTKVTHLSYLGDSDIGKCVNIGCGVVTVNYDGKTKHKTIIEDNAFIGSNANLIAPITIGKGALVAAGSTINKNVEPTDMAIARSLQVNKPGYASKYLDKPTTT